MRKVLSYSLVLISVAMFTSCDSSKQQVELEWKVYESSSVHNDRTTAITSLNRIIALEKYNSDALDTLSILYLNVGMNDAALKIATRATNVRESKEVTKVLAKANKNLGKFEQAIIHFNKLLEGSPDDLELLYESAFCNINMNKPNDAVPFIEKMIKHPESGSQVMQEFYQNSQQFVPYKSVALNMLGYLQAQAGQNEAAVQSYQAALQIFPKYYLAQNNLRVLVPQKK